jgi:sorbitol/mannitol transport system substrate-binding protein
MTETNQYSLSKPFYGDSIVLLKPKSLNISLVNPSTLTIDDYIAQLTQYRFGIIRGSLLSKQYPSLAANNINYATNNIQNIDDLSQGIVDFIIIGKYSAAEIITNKRPHLIGSFEVIQPKNSNNAFRIAFSKKNKNHQRIKNSFDKGLMAIQQNGTLNIINQKHGMYPPQKQSNKTTLTIGTVNNKDMLQLKALSESFEEAHQDIHLDWHVYDENTLRSRTLSDLAISDGQFDIVTIGLQEIPVWSKNKWLSPIKNLSKEYDVPDIFERLIEAHSYEDELHALPFYAESSVTYYRKDLFLKADITMNEQPTYADIITYAEAVHNPEEGIFGLCLRGKAGWGENMALFTTMVNTYGGKWFDKNWQPQINSEAWKQALNTYHLLLTKYSPPKPELNGYNENLELFLKGKCGIWIDSTIASSSLFNSEASLVSNHVAVVKAPIANTVRGSNWLWAWSFAISTYSKNKDAAQKFITWATSKEYIALLSKNMSYKAIPQGTRISTYTNDSYQDVMPYSHIILRSMTDASKQSNKDDDKPYKGIQFVEISEFPSIANHVGLLISDVIQGKTSTDNALKKAQKYTKLQMRLSGYYEIN